VVKAWKPVRSCRGNRCGLCLVCVQVHPEPRCWAKLAASQSRTRRQRCCAASGTGIATACWARQVDTFLHFMSPIVDGVAQRIDPDVVTAVLQRCHFEEVNGLDGRKVREWLQISGSCRIWCLRSGWLSAGGGLQDHPRSASAVPHRLPLAGGGDGSVGQPAARAAALQALQRSTTQKI